MTKKLLPCGIALFIASCAFAQGDWFNPANEWTFHVTSGWVGYGIERIKPAGDTVYNNEVWAKMAVRADFQIGTSNMYERLVRQDGRKLYALANGTTPFLMYDFDMSEGDSLHLPIWGIFGEPYGYVVRQTGDTLIGGTVRRTQVIEWFTNTLINGGSAKGTLIEGIGYVLGTHIIGAVDCLSDSYFFLDEPAYYISDGPERIFCSFSSDWGTFDGLGQTFCAALVSTHTAELPNIDIFPNPSMGEINVRFDSDIPQLDLRLTDLSGRLLMHEVLTSTGSVTTPFKGSAVLQIQTSDGRRLQRLVQLF